jgi:hypothetical protein
MDLEIILPPPADAPEQFGLGIKREQPNIIIMKILNKRVK